MPDLSSMFKLPTVGEVTAIKDKAVNYAMAAPKKLLEEGMAKVQGVFGAIQNPFSKLSQSVPVPTKITGLTEVQGSATEYKASTASEDSSDDSTAHKVKLVAQVADGSSEIITANPNFVHEPLMQRVVEFDVMPEVQEIHSAEYEALSAPHMPLEFQKYKGTKSIQWQINGTFTCRTRDEAKRNYIYLNNLRGWTKPYFGENQRKQFAGKLGAPPPVLDFSGWRGLVGKVPTVITGLNWNWPKDCDWIPTGIKDEEGSEIPFPTVMNVNIALVESFSPDQVNGFNLVEFRNGNMIGAWSSTVSQDPGPDVSEAMGSNGGNQSITNGTPQPGGDEPEATTDEYPNETRRFAASSEVPIASSLATGESLVGAKLPATVDEAKSTAAVVAQGAPANGSSIPPAETVAGKISGLTTLRTQFVELRDDSIKTLKSTVEEAKTLVSQGLGGSPAYEQTKVQFSATTAIIESVDRDIAKIDDKLVKLKGGA